jgi:hypothetical protein
LAVAADRSSAAFDVLPREFTLLHRGTRDLVDAYLETMGLDTRALSWTIRRLCSPYFAVHATADHNAAFEDRYRQFFGVEVKLAEPLATLPPPSGFKPWFTEERDPTWPGSGIDLDWTTLDCVVIADHVQTPPREQLRIDLGALMLNGDDTAIRKQLSQLTDAGASLHWQHSRTRYLQLG